MTLTWFGWTLVLLLAFNALLMIAYIGKPRKPVDPAGAICVVVVNSLLILGAVCVGTTP